MKISIIIPTHNRAESLRNTIESIVALENEASFEIVIVDNNSTDHTKEVAQSYSKFVHYVFEKSTAFTKARGTGGKTASGDIFLYIDDDVLLIPGSLKKIVEVFNDFPVCGVIAGKILPKYTETPPDWTLACQNSFNGWSLYNPETYKNLGYSFQEVHSAAGPMMAIRRAAYEKVGGFPPDTIGVETNTGERTFKKLYIGPGDYGLCIRIREADYKVYYSPDIACFHVIPPVRFTIGFWRSRMIGEGHYIAIANRGFFHYSPSRLFIERKRAQIQFYQFKKRMSSHLESLEQQNNAGTNFIGVLPEELWVRYYSSYLEMDWVLRKYPELWRFLWKIGYEGVSDDAYDEVVKFLPAEYKEIVSEDILKDISSLNATALFKQYLKTINRNVVSECSANEDFIQKFYTTITANHSDVNLLNVFLIDQYSNQAANILQAISKNDPMNTELLKWIGSIYKEQCQEDFSLECFQRAHQLNPDDEEVKKLLQELQITDESGPIGDISSQKALKLFNEGKSLIESHQYENALAKLDEAIYLKPRLQNIHLARAICFTKTNQKLQAATSAVAELALQPNNQEALNLFLSNIDTTKESIKANPKTILELLEQVHRYTKHQIDGSNVIRALCLIILSRFREAIAVLKDELSKMPTDNYLRSLLSKTMLTARYQGDFGDSSLENNYLYEILTRKEVEAQLTEKKPPSAGSPYPPNLPTDQIFLQNALKLIEEAQGLLKQENYQETLRLLDEAMYFYSFIMSLQYLRAVCLTNLGRPTEAEIALNAELKIQPDFAPALALQKILQDSSGINKNA
jgi:glycosyltransferase involved in cell wall biosynthesis/predicted Zn-dependent protease